MSAPHVTVAAFVGTRADLGPLGPVLTALADAPDLDLTVLTGVAWTARVASRSALPSARRAVAGRGRSPTR